MTTISDPHCPTCGDALYTSNDGEGPVRACGNGHKFRWDPVAEAMPPAIREAAEKLGYVSTGELSQDDLAQVIGENLDAKGAGTLGLVGELQAQDESQINTLVPLPTSFTQEMLEDLIGDDTELPRQVVVEIRAGESRNGRVWSADILRKIVSEVNDGGLPGNKGHQKPENINSEFVDPVTHWIAAKEVETGRFLFRGVPDKGTDPNIKRMLRTKRTTQVSIFGRAATVMRSGKQVIKDFKPFSIDWVPPKRAGMPTTIVAMEMDQITNPGVEVPEGPDKPVKTGGGKVDLAEIIGELRKEGVKPDQLIGEMNWRPEDVVKATGLTLEKVAPALASDEWDALQVEHKTFGEMAELLGEKDPEKITAAIKAGKEALESKNTEGRDKIVAEVLEDKVAGDTAQALVKDMLVPTIKDGASKDDIEKLVGEILEKPHVKTMLKGAKLGSNGPSPKTDETKKGNKDGALVGASRRPVRL